MGTGSGPFQVIRVYDPAIDRDASDLSQFALERDPSHLVYTEGAQPVVFHCRRLTLNERRDARNKATDCDRYEAAFVRGLVKVERLPVGEDGETREWRRAERGGKQVPITDSELEQLFAEVDVQEVGMVIWVKSTLFFHRGSRGYYPLLPMSRDALTGTLFHLAEQKSASGTSGENRPPPAEAETPAT